VGGSGARATSPQMATIYDYDGKSGHERLIVDTPALKIRSFCSPIPDNQNIICLHQIDFGQGWMMCSRPAIRKILTDLNMNIPSHLA
jgi:hypothetical protein